MTNTVLGRQPDQLAFELPTGEPVISNVGAADLPANESKLTPEGELAREALSAALWLYRRLPRSYGRPPHIEVPLQRLARLAGTDVADCLAERGPDPKGEPHGQ